MSTLSLDRIVALWPNLSEEARDRLVAIAEQSADAGDALDLSAEDEVRLEKSRADFANGRTLGLPELQADLDAFFATQRRRSGAA